MNEKQISDNSYLINQLEISKHHGKMPHAWIIAGENIAHNLEIIKDFTANNLLKGVKNVRERMIDGTIADFKHVSGNENLIAVDEIRAINSFISKTQVEAEYKVVIIENADQMNDNAANAFLKTLEEPAEDTIIFLLAKNLYKLSKTIRSRCRIVVNSRSIAKKIDVDIYKNLEGLLEKFSFGQFNKLAEGVAKDDALWSDVKEIMREMLTNRIKSRQIITAEIVENAEKIHKIFIDTDRASLDKKVSLFIALNLMLRV